MGLIKLDEFVDMVKRELDEYYEGEMEVKIVKVLKNNDVEYTGVSLVSKNSKISPTVYLDSYYCQYIDEKPLKYIVDDIVEIYDNHHFDVDCNMDFFNDYELCKDRILFKVVNKEKNTRLLKDVPYIEYLDMAIVFYYLINCDLAGNATILIKNTHIENWGCKVDELFKDAKDNTRRLLKTILKPLHELILESMIQKVGYELGIEDEYSKEEAEKIAHELNKSFMHMPDDMPMYVLSNEIKQYGASVILYEDVLKAAANVCDGDFYMLPSSIHEVIIIGAKYVDSPKNLADMVKDVNETQLSDEEVLTDSVYYYNSVDNELSVMCI